MGLWRGRNGYKGPFPEFTPGLSGPPEDYVTHSGLWRASAWAADSFNDQSANNRDLTTAGFVAGTTALVGGWGVADKDIMVLDGGTQSAVAATAAPWKALHTGTGSTWWSIFRCTGVGVSPMCLFDTGPVNSLSHGIRVYMDGIRNRIGVEIYNGLGDGLLPFISSAKYSWNDTLSIGDPHVIVVTFSTTGQDPHYQVWLDGQLIESWSMGDRWHTDAEQPALSSSNPTGPLCIGSTSAATAVWYGELAEFGVTDTVVSFAQRNAIQAYAVSEYGVSLAPTLGLIVFDGNSMTDNVFYAGRWPEICTPKLWMPVSSRMRAVAGNDAIHLIDRIAEHVTPDIQGAPFNIVLSTECLNSIANGRTKEEAYTDFVAYCQALPASAAVIVETIIPAGRVSIPLITQEKIDYFNTQLIANWESYADGLARPDLDPVIGDWDVWDADYDGGTGPGVYWEPADGIHLTDAGDILKEPYWTTAINEWLAANVDIPAPVLTSVSPESGIQAGGTALTLTGTHFIYGATVTIGGAACTSVVHVDRQTITCVSPAGSEGDEDIVVTNPDNQTDTLADGFTYIPNFPALAHALYVDGNYSSGLFAGLATTGGTSANNDLTEATNPPAVTTLNGYNIASFDGSNDILNADGTMADYLDPDGGDGATIGSGWALFNYTAATADAGIGNNEMFLGDSNQTWGMGFTDEGIEAFTTTASDGAVRVQIACPVAEWHLLQYSFDVLATEKLRIRLDGGAWTEFSYFAGSTSGLGFLTATVLSGCKGNGGSPFGQFKLAAMGQAKTLFSEANFNSIRTYLNAKYDISV